MWLGPRDAWPVAPGALRPATPGATDAAPGGAGQSRLLLAHNRGAIYGVLEAGGQRFEVGGSYDPRGRILRLGWGGTAGAPLRRFIGTIDRGDMTLSGAWDTPAQPGPATPLTLRHVAPRAVIDRPSLTPAPTAAPDATPTVVAFVPPPPTATPIPLAHPDDPSGVWIVPGGFYILAPGQITNAVVILRAIGQTVTGTAIQDGAHLPLTGTYRATTRTLSFTIPLPSGGAIAVGVTIDSSLRQATGSIAAPNLEGGFSLTRGGDPHSPAAATAIAAAAAAAAVAPTVTPTPGAPAPTPIYLATPIPSDDIDGAWTFPGFDPSVMGPAIFYLRRRGGDIAGEIDAYGARFPLRGTYSDGTLTLDWSLPHYGAYRFQGSLGNGMTQLSGLIYDPRAEGGAFFQRLSETSPGIHPSYPDIASRP